MFSNDDRLADGLAAAGKASGDLLWRLPMNENYNKIMDSPIADMKNSASREGGSITAACFLERFVEEGVKWAHLDIAGMVWADKASHLYDKGATGFGVALLDRYVADNHEGKTAKGGHMRKLAIANRVRLGRRSLSRVRRRFERHYDSEGRDRRRTAPIAHPCRSRAGGCSTAHLAVGGDTIVGGGMEA